MVFDPTEQEVDELVEREAAVQPSTLFQRGPGNSVGLQAPPDFDKRAKMVPAEVPTPPRFLETALDWKAEQAVLLRDQEAIAQQHEHAVIVNSIAPHLPPDLAGATLSKPELSYKDCTNELWCEYVYYDAQGVRRVYHIDRPQKMFYYKGCTTHRVLDAAGVVHIVPAISQGGCVRRYVPSDPSVPVLG